MAGHAFLRVAMWPSCECVDGSRMGVHCVFGVGHGPECGRLPVRPKRIPRETLILIHVIA